MQSFLKKASNFTRAQLNEFLKFVKSNPKLTVNENSQGDLFGFDDSAIQQAEILAKKANAHINDLKTQIKAVKNAIAKPEKAKLGKVNVAKNAKSQLEKIENDLHNWENWHTNPELYKQLMDEANNDNTAKFDIEAESKSYNICNG